MPLRKLLFFMAWFALMLSLAIGYGLVGHWVGVALAGAVGLGWVVALEYPEAWLTFTCLTLSIGLAVVGRLTGATPGWMLCAAGLALAVWDLLFLNSALKGSLPAEHTRRYERAYLRALGLALAGGLGVASLGRLLVLRLSFLVLVILIGVVVFGLDRLWIYLRQRF